MPYRLSASGSVALWYYVPGPWYNYNSIFDNSVHNDHYECWIDEWGNLQFRPAGGAWPQRAKIGLGSGSNRWYHVVGTWDAFTSNMVMYVNGVERSRAVNTNGMAWPVAGTNFFIGGGHAGNTPGRGSVCDLQIFETPLSSNRVAEIFNEKRAWQGGLIAYVPFDGTAVDVAGGNAVVLGGSPTYVKTQGAFYKGLSCGTLETNISDNASISNVLGSKVGTIALWYYARGPWYNYQTIFDNPINQIIGNAGSMSPVPSNHVSATSLAAGLSSMISTTCAARTVGITSRLFGTLAWGRHGCISTACCGRTRR